MTVEEMTRAAALMADRDDEFIRDDGDYDEEALRILEICLNAFNEADAEIARKLLYPIATAEVVPQDFRINLTDLDPPFLQIIRLEDSSGFGPIPFKVIDRDTLEVGSSKALRITYNHLPDRMEDLTDKPIYHEAQVPPELYIALAAARIYQSEKKHDTARPFEIMYYDKLRRVKPVSASSARRLPRRRFR